MTAKFQEGLWANVPYKNRFAVKAQILEVLCGVLTKNSRKEN
jgi:hypothetical protein